MFNFLKKSSAAVGGILLSLLFFSCAKPGDSTVQNAVTAYGAGKYDQALELFTQALEQETRYSDELIFTFISNVYAAQDDFENAAVWMEKSLEKKPDYRGYVTLGMNYQSIKNFEKAEINYRKAIALDENKGEGWASLGILYLEEGKTEKAVENLEKGVVLAPKIAVIHANLAVAYAMAGQSDRSEEELKKAQELQCSNLDQFEEKIENIYLQKK